MITIWIIVAIIAILIIWIVAIYNGLVRLRQNIENAFADTKIPWH